MVAFWVAWQSATLNLSSITATGGAIGPVALLDNPTLAGTYGSAAMGYAQITTGGATTFKATLSGPTQIVFIVHEISGVNTATPLDNNLYSINAQNSPGIGLDAVTTGTVTTTTNNDYIFAAMWQVQLASGTDKGQQCRVDAEGVSEQQREQKYDVGRHRAGSRRYCCCSLQAGGDQPDPGRNHGVPACHS
jgi:hypothetical protein